MYHRDVGRSPPRPCRRRNDPPSGGGSLQRPPPPPPASEWSARAFGEVGTAASFVPSRGEARRLLARPRGGQARRRSPPSVRAFCTRARAWLSRSRAQRDPDLLVVPSSAPRAARGRADRRDEVAGGPSARTLTTEPDPDVNRPWRHATRSPPRPPPLVLSTMSTVRSTPRPGPFDFAPGCTQALAERPSPEPRAKKRSLTAGSVACGRAQRSAARRPRLTSAHRCRHSRCDAFPLGARDPRPLDVTCTSRRARPAPSRRRYRTRRRLGRVHLERSRRAATRSTSAPLRGPRSGRARTSRVLRAAPVLTVNRLAPRFRADPEPVPASRPKAPPRRASRQRGAWRSTLSGGTWTRDGGPDR
jgi:hypothetical protein